MFVHHNGVHRRRTDDYGYHIGPASQATVTMDWNMVFNHHWFFIPPDEVNQLTGAYPLNTPGFHPPVAFVGLCSVHELAPLYAFALWFDEGTITERPPWLHDGLFGDGIVITSDLVAPTLYQREMSLRNSEVAQKLTREPRVYRLAKYLLSYFHVCRSPSDGRSIVGYCDEWLVREDWETTFVLDMASTLEEQELPNVEGPRVLFDMSALYLPALLDIGFRDEI